MTMTFFELVEMVNDREVFGQKGVRDPENGRCEYFDPVPNIDWLGLYQRARGDGTCQGDGHYLCKGCSEFEQEEDDEELELQSEAELRYRYGGAQALGDESTTPEST